MLFVGASGVDDAPHQTVAEEVRAADSAAGKEECCYRLRVIAEVTSQLVQHVLWQ